MVVNEHESLNNFMPCFTHALMAQDGLAKKLPHCTYKCDAGVLLQGSPCKVCATRVALIMPPASDLTEFASF